MGIDTLNEWAGKFGLTSKTGIELPGESTGICGCLLYTSILLHRRLCKIGAVLRAGVAVKLSRIAALQLFVDSLSLIHISGDGE